MGIFNFFKKSKQNKEIVDTSAQSLAINDADKGLEVVLEFLPSTFNEEQGHLVEIDRKSTRVNSSHACLSRMPSSA